MKKKLLSLMFVVILSLTACVKESPSTKTTVPTETAPQSQSSTVVTEETEETEETTDLSETQADTNLDADRQASEETIPSAIDNIAETSASLDNIVKYLKEKDLLEGEPTEVDADMIGAVSGVKYSDSLVEIYVYDTESDIYKALSQTNEVELQGLGLLLTISAVNGKYVLFCEDALSKADIISAFESYQQPQ